MTETFDSPESSINGTLAELVEKTEALTALLISRHGICLGQAGGSSLKVQTVLSLLQTQKLTGLMIM